MPIFYCLAVAALLSQATAPSGDSRHNIEFTKDTLAVVKKNVADGHAVLVDVRSQEEWNKGHLEDAIFLPIDSLSKTPDPKMLAKKLPQKKVLYTFCVVGMRAKAAAIKLEQAGYTVRPLKPGYEDLLKAGFKKAAAEKAVTTEHTNL